MPLLDITISDNIKVISNELVSELTQISADISGKPKNVIMTRFSQDEIYMDGEKVSGAFIEYRYAGIMEDNIKKTFCSEITKIIHKYFLTDDSYIYINFVSVNRNDWGVGEELLK